MIHNVAKKRKRTTAEVSSRTTNYVYHVRLQHSDFKVCKTAFASIHGLGKKKMQILLEKRRQSPSGTPVLDKRGLQPSPRAITGTRLDRVHEHIRSLPVTSSHYSRLTTPHRQYLEEGSSIGELHNAYIFWMNQNYPGECKVTQRFYHTIFTRDYNIVFKPPKTDVCVTCVAFYKRKLWVYNFCIYDISLQEATMFVWDETVAGRGSEVAICLLKWLKIKADAGHDFATLRVFCDNCAGQNKNIYVILMALQQIHKKRLFRIEFVFLKPGHSYMPCDRTFGNIEKKIKKGFYIKNDYNYAETPDNVTKARLMKSRARYSRQAFDLSEVALSLRYTHDRVLKKAKCTDLRNLLPLLESSAQEWLEGVLQRQEALERVAFYKRKLWVYNFCIYDISLQEATMFVWDETVAGRGSEVAICLLKWLKIKADAGHDFATLRVFCDNCAGQNKNIYVILMALQQIHKKRLFRIEFVFLKPGHSYMPCDRTFGNIEKKIKSRCVPSPKDYMDLIASAVTRRFPVVAMKREDFFDIKTLASKITNRHTPGFATACQLVVDVHYPEGFYIKNDYNYAETPDNVTKARLMKSRARYSRQAFDLSEVALSLRYTHDRVLKKAKCTDLRNLLPLLESSAQEWLEGVLQRQEALEREEHNVALDSGESEDDPDNDTRDYIVPVSAATRR
ncbi:hypothetical protein GWK47_012486 [Chionoecetes opilio]|uniref:DUF7869 domain-containing protein n=1 Tax=Chionoecetes opilio TaxID=41210 RepID=A0A8J4Y196_CHIOP|nr:hypothetical protein GWK47_012486 [Chionoecetes opilio]